MYIVENIEREKENLWFLPFRVKSFTVFYAHQEMVMPHTHTDILTY